MSPVRGPERFLSALRSGFGCDLPLLLISLHFFLNLWIKIKITTLSSGLRFVAFSSGFVMKTQPTGMPSIFVPETCAFRCFRAEHCTPGTPDGKCWRWDRIPDKGWPGGEAAQGKAPGASREGLSPSLPIFLLKAPKNITPTSDLQILLKWDALGSLSSLHPDRVSCWTDSHFNMGCKQWCCLAGCHRLSQKQSSQLCPLSLEGTLGFTKKGDKYVTDTNTPFALFFFFLIHFTSQACTLRFTHTSTCAHKYRDGKLPPNWVNIVYVYPLEHPLIKIRRSQFTAKFLF